MRCGVDFSNAVEGAMGGGGSLAAIRAFANKAGEHALRLAGILTVYRDQDAAEIDAETVVNAIELVTALPRRSHTGQRHGRSVRRVSAGAGDAGIPAGP